MHTTLAAALTALLVSGAVLTPAASAAPAGATAPAASAEPRFVVFGVDRSEPWNAMSRTTLGLAEQALLRDARPGDELVYRWISDRSYAADEAFAHIVLPTLSRAANPLDRQGRANEASSKQALARAAEEGLAQLRRHVPGATPAGGRPDLRKGTPSTDIYGFVTAAAGHFAAAPAGRAKQLVIASDMEDNRRYQVRPDLKGVEVVVYLVSLKADPVAAQRLQAQWTDFFRECGATRTSFRPVMPESAK
jgi:hypothetical protein